MAGGVGCRPTWRTSLRRVPGEDDKSCSQVTHAFTVTNVHGMVSLKTFQQSVDTYFKILLKIMYRHVRVGRPTFSTLLPKYFK